MGARPASPYRHLIKRIHASTTTNTEDKRQAVAAVNSFIIPHQRINLEEAEFICAGLYSMWQALRIQSLMDTMIPSGSKYRELTWSYSKHMQNYKNTLAAMHLGKGERGRSKGKEKTEPGSALWRHARPGVIPSAGGAGV